MQDQLDHNNCCICFSVDLDSLIYQSKSTLDVLSQKRIYNKTLGYSFSSDGNSNLETLRSYLNVIEDENLNIVLGGKPCLDCNKLQRLTEKIRLLSASCDTSRRKDFTTDDTNVEIWISKNPYCVSRERWEELAYRVCRSLKLELISIEQKCDISFEIIRKLIPCDIMVSIAVLKQQCDLDFKITRTEEECEIDFEILAEETTCDIDLKTYKTLIDNNWSYDIIRTVYENGCTIELNDSEDSEVEINIVTPINKYPIKDFNFSGIPDMKILKELDVDLSDSKYIKDPTNFIQKLKQDYSG